MLWLWIFMLVSELLVPAVMAGFGAYFSRHAPREINSAFDEHGNRKS